jgi:hypothetical protein
MRNTQIAMALVFTACTDNDDQCRFDDLPSADSAPAIELRDPFSGVCQPFGFGGGGECNDPCGRCPPVADLVAQPDWGQCNAGCEGRDEASCKSTSACRAAYAGGTFHECWSVAPSGPVQGGDCTSLSAQECSRHDDCVAHHAPGSPIGAFTSCAPEGSVQDPGSCVGTITCATPQPTCPANTLPGKRNGCWTGYCIPLAQCDSLPACTTLAEVGCIGRSDCAPIYEGMNCTCNGTSCTCQTWTFDTCEAK